MMSRPEQIYRGSCHCGAVQFEISTDFPELTMCDCSLCRKKNALMVKVHESKFRLLAGAEQLAEYQFHTHRLGPALFLQDLWYLPVSPQAGNAG